MYQIDLFPGKKKSFFKTPFWGTSKNWWLDLKVSADPWPLVLKTGLKKCSRFKSDCIREGLKKHFDGLSITWPETLPLPPQMWKVFFTIVLLLFSNFLTLFTLKVKKNVKGGLALNPPPFLDCPSKCIFLPSLIDVKMWWRTGQLGLKLGCVMLCCTLLYFTALCSM